MNPNNLKCLPGTDINTIDNVAELAYRVNNVSKVIIVNTADNTVNKVIIVPTVAKMAHKVNNVNEVLTIIKVNIKDSTDPPRLNNVEKHNNHGRHENPPQLSRSSPRHRLFFLK